MEGKSIGIIGMGDMGKMYARRLSDAGWKYVSSMSWSYESARRVRIGKSHSFSHYYTPWLQDDRECIWLECGDMAVLKPFWRQTAAVSLPLM